MVYSCTTHRRRQWLLVGCRWKWCRNSLPTRKFRAQKCEAASLPSPLIRSCRKKMGSPIHPVSDVSASLFRPQGERRVNFCCAA